MEKAFLFYVKAFDYIVRFMIVLIIFSTVVQPNGGIYREVFRTFVSSSDIFYPNAYFYFDLKTFSGLIFFTILGFVGIHFVNTMTYKLLTFQKYISQISYINLLSRIGLWTYISILVSCFVEILILSIEPTFFG